MDAVAAMWFWIMSSKVTTRVQSTVEVINHFRLAANVWLLFLWTSAI